MAISTAWTGLAGNGLWNDPANWTDGVPPSGLPFANGSDDVATLDNSIETTPFTVTIAGSAVGDTVNVNLTDPVGAPSVRLTGTLDLASSGSPGGGFSLGTLNLDGGTFEVDGGTLRALTVEQNDTGAGHAGHLTFGPAATYGTATLDIVGIQGDFTIGNASSVTVALHSFAAFEKEHGGVPATVTVDGNSTFSIAGTLALHGTLDIKSGTVTLDDGGGIVGDSVGATVIADGGTFTINAPVSTLDNVTLAGDVAVGSQVFEVIAADTVVLENLSGADTMTGSSPRRRSAATPARVTACTGPTSPYRTGSTRGTRWLPPLAPISRPKSCRIMPTD